MLKNVEQLRSLIEGIDHCRKVLKHIYTRLHPINDLLKEAVKFVFTSEIILII